MDSLFAGLIKALEAERDSLSQRSRSLVEEEKKMAAGTATLQQEKEAVKKEQERLAELATKIKSEMDRVDTFSKVIGASILSVYLIVLR